jgi:hypothetical protein
VEQQLAQVQQQFGSQQAFEQALSQSGRTLEQYRQTLTQQYMDQTMMQRFAQKRVEKMAKPNVSDDEIAAYFERQRERLGARPATLSFQQADHPAAVASDSARAAARRTAEKMLAELRAGGDFEVLARRYSAGRRAPQQGGMLGWFREGQMVRPFEAMAYSLRPGDTSPIVETEYGYHIIRLEKVARPRAPGAAHPDPPRGDRGRRGARPRHRRLHRRRGAHRRRFARRAGRGARLPGPTSAAEPEVLAGPSPARVHPPLGAPARRRGGPLRAGHAFGDAGVRGGQDHRRGRRGAPTQLSDVADQVRERVQQQKRWSSVLTELRRTTYVILQ